jgi:3-hydroxyisobutyrate dehydrogenase-like beta-hydroxyacid dehydrogenase
VTCVGLIGFGEAGRALAPVLAASGSELVVHDLAFAVDPARTRAVTALGGSPAPDPAGLAGCDPVLSLVTPATAVAAATAFAPSASGAPLYVDLNSTTPADKHAIVAAVPGARVVDGVMTGGGIRLDGARIPISLAGPAAGEAAEVLTGLGLNATVVGGAVGGAAALKMLRGVVVKGLEALCVEALLAAAELDLVEPLLDDVAATLDRPAREFLSMLVTTHVAHAGRRRVEADKVRETVAGTGVPPVMSTATAEVLGRTADGLRGAGGSPATVAEALAVLRGLTATTGGEVR